MSKKMRIKIGPIEIELEFENELSTEALMEVANAAADVYNAKQLWRSNEGPVGSELAARLQIQGSTASIAGRLNCISGPELIIAAAAHLTFVDGEEWFDAQSILREMKKAAAHYSLSYQDALKGDLEGLVQSGKLEEVSENLYAISATMRRELQQALAE